MTLRAYLFNLFDNQHPTEQDVRWSTEQPPGYPDSIYDPNQPQSNPEYGKYLRRNDPRLFRAAVRVSF